MNADIDINIYHGLVIHAHFRYLDVDTSYYSSVIDLFSIYKMHYDGQLCNRWSDSWKSFSLSSWTIGISIPWAREKLWKGKLANGQIGNWGVLAGTRMGGCQLHPASIRFESYVRSKHLVMPNKLLVERRKGKLCPMMIWEWRSLPQPKAPSLFSMDRMMKTWVKSILKRCFQ